MNFAQWYLEYETEPKQQLFPFATEEEPLDWKRISRYKSPETYIKSQVKGARDTEQAARSVVAAPINSFLSGSEEIERIYHNEIIIPAKQFPNGQIRPERAVAFVLIKKLDPFVNGNRRLLAFYQGDPNKKLNKSDLLSGLDQIIGGLIFKGSYLTHTWVDPNYKGPDINLYKNLREFARKYYGVMGLEPGDNLTSKSFRTSQAKYDWKRFQQWRQSQGQT